MPNNLTLLRTGIIGTAAAALCCFTPVLVILLGTVGLSALTGYLDIVLLPALIFFVGLTAYAVYRRHRGRQQCDTQRPSE
ncbi:MAG: hypothetical protein A3I00_00870 [Betaproteobacteria bacterium RIFCSPLOWO2_02_FULL_64_12]|nr:MAG: hypothetical protein A3I00_00870 [Betaproteobacteria bacterium RIFCSPLOWO2_02_FULL_64_12]